MDSNNRPLSPGSTADHGEFICLVVVAGILAGIQASWVPVLAPPVYNPFETLTHDKIGYGGSSSSGSRASTISKHLAEAYPLSVKQCSSKLLMLSA
jgi:hypothetical protein